MIYPSFISLATDEMRRFNLPNEVSTEGTTKHIHRRRIWLDEYCKVSDELIFIDTPGTRTKLSKTYRGMFEGDFGICLISLNDIEGYRNALLEKNYSEFSKHQKRIFEPLQVWCALKDPNKLIVVLSKVDEYNKDELDKATELIQMQISDLSARMPSMSSISFAIS